MQIVYSHHEGTQVIKPPVLDTDSSKSAIYLRKNIQQEEKEDKQSGTKIKVWSYDEAILTPAEYERFKEDASAELLAKSSTDNLSIMDAIATTYEQSFSNNEQGLDIMTAIADVYEAISSTSTTA